MDVRLQGDNSGDDRLTLAAIGVLAMCVVTTAHEALGHGVACVSAGGQIKLLTSSMFSCSVASPWIDPAGPATNLLVGTLALILNAALTSRWMALRTLLTAITALAYFWEAAYLVEAMLIQRGDAYYFLQSINGEISVTERVVIAMAGVALYAVATRLTSRALAAASPDAGAARKRARTIWLGATVAASLAAALCHVAPFENFRDAVLEIGASSVALLFMRPRNASSSRGDKPARGASTDTLTLTRDMRLVALALIALFLFAATLGRGVADSQMRKVAHARVTRSRTQRTCSYTRCPSENGRNLCLYPTIPP